MTLASSSGQVGRCTFFCLEPCSKSFITRNAIHAWYGNLQGLKHSSEMPLCLERSGVFLLSWNSNPRSASFLELPVFVLTPLTMRWRGHPRVHVVTVHATLANCPSIQVWVHLGGHRTYVQLLAMQVGSLTSNRYVSPARGVRLLMWVPNHY